MSFDHTQQQSPDEQQRARDLSLSRSRPPIEIPGYEIQQFLGAGAYGEVWVGADKNTGRRVAIKFYAHRSGVDWALISREVEKLVFLSADRYVVQLLDVGWNSDPPYYVMEYVDHGSLDDYLRSHGALPVPEAVELFREIAVGLLHAHGKGVLHCDLKPGNILLDTDHHPRLADFGQSRLSHEQRPALGTLFYMAPEQADLESVPDARWDVYALGALFYCMLTGAPPHRTERSVTEIEHAKDLPDRLARYRRVIRTAPRPNTHGRVRGLDRALAEIIDRCLAVDAAERFGNVQGVLDALHARDIARARRPLEVLGFVGPVVLLVIMALFGFRGYARAVKNTESLAKQRAIERNRFAAQLAAERVAGEILHYFEIVRDEADKPDLRQPLLYDVLENNWLHKLNDPHTPPSDVVELREKFVADEQRVALTRYVEARLKAYRDKQNAVRRAPKFASMFVTDRYGTMLAAAFNEPVASQSIGRNWAHRTYFHGGTADLPPLPRPRPDATHIEETHLSAVFKSTTTQKYKVAISTPIYREMDDGEQSFVGILVLTVNHNDFEFFRTNNTEQTDQFAFLVDGRRGPDGQPTEDTGKILQHPLFDQVIAQQGSLPDEFRNFRVPPEQLNELLTNDSGQTYVDPLRQYELGTAFDKRWIASAAPVHLVTAESGDHEESGLIVLVQENFDAVIAPVHKLGNQLLREGLTALAVVITVAAALWYFVSRFLVQVPVTASFRPPGSTPLNPLHERSTIALPNPPHR